MTNHAEPTPAPLTRYFARELFGGTLNPSPLTAPHVRDEVVCLVAEVEAQLDFLRTQRDVARQGAQAAIDTVARLEAELATLIRALPDVEEIRPLHMHIDSLEAQVAALTQQLERIRDGRTGLDCQCEHCDENCCAVVGEYCPPCIAAKAIEEARRVR